MGFIGTLLLVVFVIISVLLILMVLVQSEDGDSLGGIFAGGSSSAFGSRSGNVMTKTTQVLGALFLITSFALAWVNRSSIADTLEVAPKKAVEAGAGKGWWGKDKEVPPPAEIAPAATSETSPVAPATPAEGTPAPVAPAAPKTE